MKRPLFTGENIYHVFNRGVDKRDVFLDDVDRYQFIHDMFEFNDKALASTSYYKIRHESSEVELRKIKDRKPRTLLVDILAFCLMNNHFHFLLKQRIDGGITKFMQKLAGYTRYFNNKYQRSGYLFEGKCKAVLVEKDAHFIHLPYYIHANPLDLMKPEDRGNTEKELTFLKSYRWSSYLDYMGKKNFPSVTQREFLLSSFGNTEQHKKDFTQWLRLNNEDKFSDISDIKID